MGARGRGAGWAGRGLGAIGLCAFVALALGCAGAPAREAVAAREGGVGGRRGWSVIGRSVEGRAIEAGSLGSYVGVDMGVPILTIEFARGQDEASAVAAAGMWAVLDSLP